MAPLEHDRYRDEEAGIRLDELDQAPLLRDKPAAIHDRPSLSEDSSLPNVRLIGLAAVSWIVSFALIGYTLGTSHTVKSLLSPSSAILHASSAALTSWGLPTTSDSSASTYIDPLKSASWFDPAVPLPDFDPEGPFNGSALAAKCAATEWVPGRWLSSEDSQGGIGNVRNIVLNMIRYSIEGGAGLVLPSLMLRAATIDSNPDSLHRGGRASLEFFFDVPWLREQLAEHCPQMQVVDDLYHIPDLENAVFPNLFWPPDLHGMATGQPNAPRPPPGIRNMEPELFHPDLDSFFGLPEDRKPQVLRLQRPLFQFPIGVDPPAFFVQFGRLLKLAPGAQVLASQVLHELAKDATAFMGAHLRLEGDVGSAWGDMRTQSAELLGHLLQRKFSHIYVACGDPMPLAEFKRILAEQAPGVTMLTKFDLLATRPSAQAKLASLAFDQQALVDYLVLLKSDYFAGNGISSFSVNLLLKRHLTLDGAMSEPEVFATGLDARSSLMRDDLTSPIRETSWA